MSEIRPYSKSCRASTGKKMCKRIANLYYIRLVCAHIQKRDELAAKIKGENCSGIVSMREEMIVERTSIG